MTCVRLTCSLPATRRVRVRFWSGRVREEFLCDGHGAALHTAMLAKPQVASGSNDPLPAAVTAPVVRVA